LTNRKTLARLPKWAAEITQYGSFVAPLSQEVAQRNIGGLPVPVLVSSHHPQQYSSVALACTLYSTDQRAEAVHGRAVVRLWESSGSGEQVLQQQSGQLARTARNTSQSSLGPRDQVIRLLPSCLSLPAGGW
jgi:hypothetical protein